MTQAERVAARLRERADSQALACARLGVEPYAGVHEDRAVAALVETVMSSHDAYCNGDIKGARCTCEYEDQRAAVQALAVALGIKEE